MRPAREGAGRRHTPSLALALVAGALAAAPAAAQRFEFDAPWLGYHTGFYPKGIEAWGSRTADLNGDGVEDMVVGHWYSNPMFSVLLADGVGGFEQPVEYDVVLGPKDVEVADFDGDGDVDVAVTATGQFWEGFWIEIWMNDGTGALTHAGDYACGKGPNRLTAGDWDGDGDVDLATAHEDYIVSASTMGVILNDGTGAFGPPQVIHCNGATYGIANGDVTGDGLPELFVALKGAVARFDNQGGGLFTGPSILSVLGGFTLDGHWNTEVVDHDGDGDLDLFYSSIGALTSGSNTPGLVSVFENTGGGVLAAPFGVTLPGGGGAADIHLADVTGDGVLDLLTAHEIYQHWSLLPGDGAGGFLPGTAFNAGEDPQQVHAPDLDGDGVADVLLLARDSMEACVYRNPGDGSFVQPVPFDMVPADDVSPSTSSNLATGDLDGDGDLDAVVGWRDNFGGNTGGVAIAVNAGDGTFSLLPSVLAPQLPKVVGLADLDSDGDLDVYFLRELGTAWYYALNDGTARFGTVRTGGTGACNGGIDSFDLDGDGDADVVTTGCAGKHQTWLQTPGGFVRGNDAPISGGGAALDAADLNGDGYVDIVSNSGIQGWLEVSLAKPDGTYFQGVLVQAGFAVRDLEIAELDGDGILDIVTCDQNGGMTMTFLEGRGDGLFLPPVTIPGGYSSENEQVRHIDTGDVDGDGDLDVVVANYGSQDVSFWRSNGDGTFEPHVRFGVGHQAFDAHLGDFDGDGVLDVLALVEPESDVTSWYYPAVHLARGTAGDLWTDLGEGLAGTNGVPSLRGLGIVEPGAPLSLTVAGGRALAAGVFVAGAVRVDFPLRGGLLVPAPDVLQPFLTDAAGAAFSTQAWNGLAMSGLSLYLQAWLQDPGGPAGFAATNALAIQVP